MVSEKADACSSMKYGELRGMITVMISMQLYIIVA